MQIRSVRAYPLFASFERMYGGAGQVPPALLAPASHFRIVPRTGQHATLVVVESDGGHQGLGEAFGLPHAQLSASLINDIVAPVLVGKVLDSPADLLAPLAAYFAAMGHTRGAAMEALSGVDIALWDLLARQAQKPLAVLLGAALRPVPTYVSPVPFLATPDASAAKALEFAGAGFTGIKLKVGRGLTVDLEHVAAVRGAIGSGVRLMLDANCAYGTDDAVALAEALRPYDIAWLEEPIRPGAPEELAQVRRRSPVPIACGENEFTLDAFEALAKAGAADILQPNIARAGGVSGLLAIDRLCTRHGLALSPHGVGSCVAVAAAVHTACAARAFTLYEANRLPNVLRDGLSRTPLAVDAGHFTPSARHGHGCELDWDKVHAYALPPAPPAGILAS